MEVLWKAGELSLRTMRDDREDYLQMLNWLTQPAVLEFYGRNPFTMEMVLEKYRPRVQGKEPVVPCILQNAGKSIGYVQYFPMDIKEYGIEGFLKKYPQFIFPSPFAMDLFIGEENFREKGIGRQVVQYMKQYLFFKKHADVIWLDPQEQNIRAIRCYQASGFQQIGTVYDGEEERILMIALPDTVK